MGSRKNLAAAPFLDMNAMNPGSKLAKANELGIPVIDEAAFMKMAGLSDE